MITKSTTPTYNDYFDGIIGHDIYFVSRRSPAEQFTNFRTSSVVRKWPANSDEKEMSGGNISKSNLRHAGKIAGSKKLKLAM